MIIFTLKARRLITRAVNTYGNDHQREVWRSWAAAHPDVRRGPADAYEDGKGSLAPDVVQVALSTLNQMFNAMQARLNSQSLSDDETADLGNDLAFIRSLVKTLGRQARPANVGQGIAL
jgi:hypothetical protein